MEHTISDAKQREQALQPDHSFIIQAPAGSGKTDLLIKRFLLLLSRCQKPEEVLAITFTRKATLEMRERIIDAITQCSTTDHQQVTHSSEQQSDTKIDPQLQNLARQVIAQDEKCNWQLLENPRKLRILTIDALCFDLVRAMPWSSRFGAMPTLLEGQQEELAYQQAALRAIRYTDKMLETRNVPLIPTHYLLQLANVDLEKAQLLLVAMLKKRDQWMRGLQDYTQVEHESNWHDFIEADVNEIHNKIPDELWSYLLPLLEHYHQHADDAEDLSTASDLQREIILLQTLSTLLLTKEGKWRERANTKILLSADTECKETMKSVLEQFQKIDGAKQQLILAKSLPEAEFTDEHRHLLSALFQLLPLAVAELQLLFRDNNHCDYTEISQRAEVALGKLGQPSDLALLMDHKIQHILMDEVQDTSIAQVKLLAKLTEGWQNDDGRTLFLVGDPMQSIYRFRDAEVSNFLQLQQHGIGQLTLNNITLTSNFRSVETIIDWCNDAFATIFPKHSDAVFGAVEYQPSIANRQSNSSSDISLHSCQDDQHTNQIIIEKITQAIAADAQCSIGILARNRSHLIPISHALTEANIDYQAVELETVLQRPATQDLISLTRALLDMNDRIAWLSILRAPWCGMTLADLTLLCEPDRHAIIWQQLQNQTCRTKLSPDGQKRIEKFVNAIHSAIQMRHNRNISKRVVSAWIGLGGPACVEGKDLPDCQNYFEMLSEMEQSRIHIDASSIEKQAQNIWSERTSYSKIQLLTMHKAKGLQFDIVILPDLARRGRSDSDDLLRWVRLPDHLLIATLPYKSNISNNQKRKYKYLKHIQKQQLENEQTRLLYVACTRARNKLHLLFSLRYGDNEKIKDPIKGSLLATLWPFVEQNLEQIDYDTPHHSNENQSTGDKKQLQRVLVDWQPNPLPTGLNTTKPTIEPIAKSNEKIEFSWVSESLRVSGIAIHYLFEKFSTNSWQHWQSMDTKILVNIGRQILLENNLVDEQALHTATQYIEETIEKVKQDPHAAWLFSNQHTDIHAEWALTAWLDDQLVNIKIDRSFVDENNVRWIIDFKSSRHTGADIEHFLNQEKQRYRHQLMRYGRVVQALEQRKIKLALYFPLMQQWLDWDYDEPTPS